MGRSTPWLVVAACVLAGAGVWVVRDRQGGAAPELSPRALVQRAWTLGPKTPLQGQQLVRMVGAGGQPVTIRAKVLQSGDGRVRIEYPGDPLHGVTVWESGDRTYRYNPSLKRLTIDASRAPTEEQARAELQILQNYEVRVKGEGKVAGHTAVILELRPRSDRGRRKQLWIDRQTDVILATEDYREDGSLLRSSRYTSVRYFDPAHRPSESAFRPAQSLIDRYGSPRPGDTSARFTPAQLEKLVGFPIRLPKWLPPGFQLQGAYQSRCSCSRPHQAVRLEYGDGLSTISLFECGHPRCTSRQNCFAAGGTAPMAVRARRQGISYLAIGDVPREELERLLRSAEGR